MREENFVELLENIGLTHNQSLIYFTLIKAGKKGSIVRELNHVTDIKRTNIYPILHELIDIGCIIEGGYAEKSKNAAIYIAVEPVIYFDQVIHKKRGEIEHLQKFKDRHAKSLQTIFQDGIEITLDEIDPILRNYFKPLIMSGWKIQSYVKRTNIPMFDYEVFDCMLYAPHARILKDCSFHLFTFGYNIQNDKNALEFFSQSLKRKTKEMKSYFFDIKQIQLLDEKVEFFNHTFPSYRMRIKINDLKNSKYFSEELKEDANVKKSQFFDIGKAVIIPIKNKLFYVWAESNQILSEILEPIVKIERF
ncbi:MAG: Sugar-specific transcriptional regulator TrmB [Candidatus Lokiarchaeum sp. GC14_75]|nr:MAG: Sugar-specific transcriptional regulator TrmB [Candidatus Lokiarchaeum sp. GC14_75]